MTLSCEFLVPFNTIPHGPIILAENFHQTKKLVQPSIYLCIMDILTKCSNQFCPWEPGAMQANISSYTVHVTVPSFPLLVLYCCSLYSAWWGMNTRRPRYSVRKVSKIRQQWTVALMMLMWWLFVPDAVMQLEPQNETAAQFYPLIQERIQLGEENSTPLNTSRMWWLWFWINS